MLNNEILSLFSKWNDELNNTLIQNNSLCIAIFSTDKELLFANDSMSVLFKGEPYKSFINPTFDKLLLSDNSAPLIFEGFLTLGDNSSVNTSIWAQVYRKENNLLVVGGVNASQLLEQNLTMHQMNHEISNLQRELIKEKHALETTLRQLNQANKELKELNTSKDTFIHILAHDLINPFSLLLGYSELLIKNLHKYDIQKIEDQLKVLNETTHQTYQLLEQVLLWAKSQSGKLTIEHQTFNFLETTKYLINTIENQANKKSIEIELVENEKITITADLNMYKTIMRNLISNAIKFTHHNGQIKIYAEKNHDNVLITVSDNGIGIDKNTIKTLWENTNSYSTVGTNNEKGTGFGLILCKELIEKHGGQIWVESEVGKGSDFKLTFPINTNAL